MCTCSRRPLTEEVTITLYELRSQPSNAGIESARAAIALSKERTSAEKDRQVQRCSPRVPIKQEKHTKERNTSLTIAREAGM